MIVRVDGTHQLAVDVRVIAPTKKKWNDATDLSISQLLTAQ